MFSLVLWIFNLNRYSTVLRINCTDIKILIIFFSFVDNFFSYRYSTMIVQIITLIAITYNIVDTYQD